jgi:hypothetical protein
MILGPARVPLREMGAIDYLYVANWSLRGDVKILLRTVPHVLGRRGLRAGEASLRAAIRQTAMTITATKSQTSDSSATRMSIGSNYC